MQTVEFPALAGPVVSEFASLFAWASEAKPAPEVRVGPALVPAVRAIAEAAGIEARAVGNGREVASPGRLDPGKAVVLFSGGKDSLAAALALKARGVRPALLYCRKLNGPSYGREERSARAVAQIAGFPFRVVEARLSGKSAHIENPVKNLLLMAVGAEYAIRHGAGIVALGALEHDGDNARNFGCGLSDDPGMIELAASAIAALVPGLRGIAALHRNDADAYARVWHELPAAIPAVGSCMTGPRAHGMAREANERKFGVELLPGRCGSCYKCAFELIALAALRGEVLPAALADHCVGKLRAGLRMIRGGDALPSVDDALDAFFDLTAFDHMAALALARLK